MHPARRAATDALRRLPSRASGWRETALSCAARSLTSTASRAAASSDPDGPWPNPPDPHPAGPPPDPPSAAATVGAMGAGAVGAVAIAGIGVYAVFQMAGAVAKGAGRGVDGRAAHEPPP